jgi:hypothetical protein
MDVRLGALRNRSTACRNASAPNRAVGPAPPSRSTTASRARAAATSAAHGPWRGSAVTRTPRGRPLRRSASTTKVTNRTSTPASCAPLGGTMARRRRRRTRSKARSPSPSTHSRTVALLTPTLRETLARRPPANTAPATATTSSADEILLGRASYGSTRSRCPHSAQQARRTRSTTHASGRCSFLRRHSRVSHRSKLPQEAHRQPARRTCASGACMSSAYWVEWTPGTWTTTSSTAPCPARRAGPSSTYAIDYECASPTRRLGMRVSASVGHDTGRRRASRRRHGLSAGTRR